MKDRIQLLVDRYAQVLSVGGVLFTLAALEADTRWTAQPMATAALIAAVVVLRAVPVRLSKYSYLTQTGVAALVGGATVGPSPVVLALWIGVFASDVLWLRKLTRAGLINAGREVLGFAVAYGYYAAVLVFVGHSELSLDLLPAAAILVFMYFFASRALFYFTLLIRDKLEHAEKVLILRWEIISYLLTLIAAVVAVAALRSLAPVGWLAVALAHGRPRRAHAPHPGGGDRRRGPEQGPPDGGGDRQQPHAAGLVRPDRAAGLPAARLGRLPDLSRRRRHRDAGLSRHARAARPRRAAHRRRAIPRRGDRVEPGGRGQGRPVRSARRLSDGTGRKSRGPPDPLRRRPARDGRGGPPQAARVRTQGPCRPQHAGQPDRDGDPYRRAAPAAARHGRADRAAGHRVRPRHRFAPAPRRWRWPTRRRGCGRAPASWRPSSPAASRPPTRSAPPRAPWRTRARRPPRRAARRPRWRRRTAWSSARRSTGSSGSRASCPPAPTRSPDSAR